MFSSSEKNERSKNPEIEKGWPEKEGQLSVDVYETEKDLVIQSAIAGIEVNDLNISIEKDMLLIKGLREKPNPGEKRAYFYQECYWGPFSRQIVLPVEVDNSRAEAVIQKGILTIKIPKIKREKKTTLEVKSVG
jgi:HSP20 family protein